MGKQFVWTPVSILALILAAFLGWFLRTPKPAPKPKDVPITVGPTAAQVQPDPAYLTAPADTASWTLHDTSGATDAIRTLYIEFEKQELFPRSKEVPGTNPKRYRIPCVGPYCLSGAIGPNAVPGEIYKYWQVIGDGNGNVVDQKDGRIIIKQP